MAGTFKSSWSFVKDEVYQPFIEYDWAEAIPQDLFVTFSGELLIACEKAIEKDVWLNSNQLDAFRDQIELIETEEQKNNAYELFSAIILPDIIPDLALVFYFENVIDLLRNDYDDAWGYVFSELVASFIEKFNLGYRITNGCKILPLLTSEIREIYERISSEVGPYSDLQSLWCDFEEAYASLVKDGGDCKTPLAKGAIYLEAIAADFGVLDRSENFCNAVALYERSSKFPHKGSIYKSIVSLYGLSSNYPGIRHAGTPSSKIRDIELHDVNHIGLMFFIWAGYMHSLRVAA